MLRMVIVGFAEHRDLKNGRCSHEERILRGQSTFRTRVILPYQWIGLRIAQSALDAVIVEVRVGSCSPYAKDEDLTLAAGPTSGRGPFLLRRYSFPPNPQRSSHSDLLVFSDPRGGPPTCYAGR